MYVLLLGTDKLRSSAQPRLHTTGRSNQSGGPVGQTIAEPATSVNQISVACQLIGHNFCCRWSKAKNGGQFRVYDSCSSRSSWKTPEATRIASMKKRSERCKYCAPAAVPHRRTESAMAVVRQSQNSPLPATDPLPEGRRTAKI